MFEHDTESARCVRQDLEDTLLEERQPVISYQGKQESFLPVSTVRLAAVNDEHRPAFLVVARVEPVPLAEGASDTLVEVRDKLVEAVGLVL